MSGRTLQELLPFAKELATELGGTEKILWGGEYPSAAICLNGTHPLLVRDHTHSLTLSLPLEGSWSLRHAADWLAAEAAIRGALAQPQPLSMCDVFFAIRRELERATFDSWQPSFPGIPIPMEVWLASGACKVGLFQMPSSVSVVIWAGEDALEKEVRSIEGAGELGPWLRDGLERQVKAQAAAAAKAAIERPTLPLPDFEAVMNLIRSGVRVLA
ncbi:MAG TPA: hypothetical protein VF103_15185, partial [Polyangiaceae bacterium]